ncbi:calcitonin gene-related peptide type 1 receptor [Eurytemora carolleeae]|uniref:calcitonin gene-related peptide type 1 receptor n=1 Tax=Eurytemora carolleeae TaxID=1294199 RepID=UPI000C75B5D4|nr:calcitonin gene-related peptide type 1 receptor [Eurytemora carolleeae]|eukprot:XP_023342179.1 calcitonin gene-related peptide type 1 receptor-like [Eurytemora affinis]
MDLNGFVLPSESMKELQKIFRLVLNPDSTYFIPNKYIMNRLLECAKLFSLEPEPPGVCPLVFDSWSCFRATPQNTVQYSSCPQIYQLNYREENLAEKFCTSNGTWWIHPVSNRTWSNYTGCVDQADYRFRTIMTSISLTGLWISLMFLLIALTVFTTCRSLHCGRVTMHINLLLSLALSNIFWLIWYYTVIFEISVWSENLVWCRGLHLLVTYFTMTTYFWMLCEGTYLQLLLMNTFQVGKNTVRSLIFLGWVLPSIFIIPYANYKQTFENENCWMDYGVSRWFLGVPVAVAVIINALILCNVIRILRGKLNISSPIQSTHGGVPRSNSYSRANAATLQQAKAVFILIPILGTHFIMIPSRPEEGTEFEYVYEVISCLSSSFQGIIVSVLLCFYNSEVTTLISRRMQQFKLTHGFTAYQGSLRAQRMYPDVGLEMNPIPAIQDNVEMQGRMSSSGPEDSVVRILRTLETTSSISDRSHHIHSTPERSHHKHSTPERSHHIHSTPERSNHIHSIP